MDGIGGAVKRVVWNSVKNRRHIVNNAGDFVQAAATSNDSVVELEDAEIDATNKALGLREVFSEAPAVQGIAGMHYMQVEHGNAVCRTLTQDAIRGDGDVAAVADQMAVGD